MSNGRRSREILTHFNCGFCQKWWSIGDAPDCRTRWFCPWCGKDQEIGDSPSLTRDSAEARKHLKTLGFEDGEEYKLRVKGF